MLCEFVIFDVLLSIFKMPNLKKKESFMFTWVDMSY